MAVDVMKRPYSSMGFAPTMDYNHYPAEVNDSTLYPGIRANLEKLFDSSDNPDDRERCLRLLQSLDNGTIQRNTKRPYSAIDASSMQAKYGPYSTTYGREFVSPPEGPAQQMRPGSTKRAYYAAYDPRAPVGDTTYQKEFHRKPNTKSAPIRSGSSSGQRNNNPHPFPSFMTWKLPRKTTQGTPLYVRAPEVSNEMLEKVLRSQLSSTYQNDYLGIPQGYQMDSAFSPQDDWKSKLPYTLDSSTRETFQEPHQQPELRNETKRYASNAKKQISASGIVPTASECYKHVYPKTTYKREYTEPVDLLSKPRRGRKTPDYASMYGNQALMKQYEYSTGEERDHHLTQMIDNLRLRTPSRTPTRTPSSRGRSVTPAHAPPGCLREPTPEFNQYAHPEEVFDI